MIGDFHARAIRALPNARLVGVFDQAPGRTREFAQTHGVKAYESFDAFLSVG
jgi:predicted dehydrogenase